MNRKILVTGSGGQLGSELQKVISKEDAEFVFTNSKDLDITNASEINEVFGKYKFTHCINCAAYTNVEKAETEPDIAFQVNANGVKQVAEACKEFRVFLIHLSTDFVFNGKADRPYKPGDETAPLNKYGASKLKGEILSLETNPRTAIVRTSWLYNKTGKNFVNAILSKLTRDEPLRVVDDQFGSPTFAGDLASAIIRMTRQPAFVPGIFHYSNKGKISWFQFAEAIRDLSGSNKEIIPVSSSEFITKAKRPPYSELDCSRIMEEYKIEQLDWRESLVRCLMS